MTKFAALFWLGLVLASGFATFYVKYAVQGIDDRLRQTRKEIVAQEEQTRVLTAEWAYLNRPSRLADLNERFLRLTSITTQQLEQKIDNIPFRAPVVASAAAPLAGDGAVRVTPIATADRSEPLPVAAAAYDPGAVPSEPVTLLATAGLPPRAPGKAPVAAGRAIGLERGADRTGQGPASLNELFQQVAEAQ
jgi:hypothetical protein